MADKEEVKLLPCPFCGSTPDRFEDCEIQCSNKMCPARPSCYSEHEWNTRTAHPAAEALLKAANQALEWFAGFPHKKPASNFAISTAEECYEALRESIAEYERSRAI